MFWQECVPEVGSPLMCQCRNKYRRGEKMLEKQIQIEIGHGNTVSLQIISIKQTLRLET